MVCSSGQSSSGTPASTWPARTRAIMIMSKPAAGTSMTRWPMIASRGSLTNRQNSSLTAINRNSASQYTAAIGDCSTNAPKSGRPSWLTMERGMLLPSWASLKAYPDGQAMERRGVRRGDPGSVPGRAWQARPGLGELPGSSGYRFRRCGLRRCGLGQDPLLVGAVAAGPDLDLGAGAAPAGVVEALAGVGVDQLAVGLVDPVLGASAVAGIQVDEGAVGRTRRIDVEAHAEHLKGAVGLHRPLLGAGAVAGIDLDRVVQRGAGRPVVQAQALVPGDRAGGGRGATGGARSDGPDEALASGGAVAVLGGDRHRGRSVRGGGAGDDAAGGDRQAGGQAGSGVGQRLAAGGVLAAEGNRRSGAAGQAGLRAGMGQGDRGAELGGRDGQGGGQRQAGAGVADGDRVVAGAGGPGIGAAVPVLQVLLGEVERDGGRCAGGQVDPLEALQLQ